MLLALVALLALSSVANAAYLTTAAGQITGASADSAWGFLPAIGAADESGMVGDLHEIHVASGGREWVSQKSGANHSWSAKFDQNYELGDMWVWNSRWSADGTGGFKSVDVYYTDPTDTEQLLGNFEFGIANPANYEEDTAHQTSVPFGGVMANGVRLQQLSDHGAAFGSGGLEEVRFNIVPEPATLTLLGLGLLGLSMWRRRRR